MFVSFMYMLHSILHHCWTVSCNGQCIVHLVDAASHCIVLCLRWIFPQQPSTKKEIKSRDNNSHLILRAFSEQCYSFYSNFNKFLLYLGVLLEQATNSMFTAILVQIQHFVRPSHEHAIRKHGTGIGMR